MKTTSKYAIRCLAGGLVVLTLFVVATFWIRSLCLGAQRDLTDNQDYKIQLSPLPIVPKEIESDPNILAPSSVSVVIERPAIERLMSGDMADFEYEFNNIPVYEWADPGKPDSSWLYFDRKLGLLVRSWVQSSTDMNEPGPGQRTVWYAGPEGMSRTPDRSLGCFTSPVVSTWGFNQIVYDAELRCFLKVDFRTRKVTKGPPYPAGERHPIQIGMGAYKSADCVHTFMEGPLREAREGETGVEGRSINHVEKTLKPAVIVSPWGGIAGILVLDASGRIDMLDQQTLTITGQVATLPVRGEGSNLREPVELSAIPGLLAFEASPAWLWDDMRSGKPRQYLGCIVAAVNRDASAYSVRIFNEAGRFVSGTDKTILHSTDVPYGPMCDVARYLIENLHPPALSILSEVTAPYVEAQAGARGLFILPNSFVAARGRMPDEFYVSKIVGGLGMILPSLVLAGIMAFRVWRDTWSFGSSKNARTLWVLVTIAFGIPAYITYWLMRPKTVLLTCKNCGRLRRPDLERCQRCGSPWEVPELNPPAWRVFDGQASAAMGGTEKTRTEAEQNTDSSVNIM